MSFDWKFKPNNSFFYKFLENVIKYNFILRNSENYMFDTQYLTKIRIWNSIQPADLSARVYK